MSKNNCDITKAKAGQTVYVVLDNHASREYSVSVEKLTVTNDSIPPVECNPFYNGKVSRHSLKEIAVRTGNKKPWYIRSTKKRAEKVARDAEAMNKFYVNI